MENEPGLLHLVLAANISGFLFSLYYYRGQLLTEPIHLLPFVPDSGMAVLLFAVAIYLQTRGRTSPTLNHLAGATLLTYGTWTILILATNPSHYFTPLFSHWFYFNLLLIALPHLIMAAQSLLLEYRTKPATWTIVTTLLLLNWWLDYRHGLHTRIPATAIPLAANASLLLIAASIPGLPLLQKHLQNRENTNAQSPP